jgi:hypothetical protein
MSEGKPCARSKFTDDENIQLRSLVAQHGLRAWVEIAKLLPGRSPRQCRERWKHYLSKDQSSVPWTESEDALLFEKVSELGPKWTRIAALLGNRTDIEIKARWLHKFNHILPLFPKSRRVCGPSNLEDPDHPEPTSPLSPVQQPQDPPVELLSGVAPVNFVNFSRADECPGFLVSWKRSGDLFPKQSIFVQLPLISLFLPLLSRVRDGFWEIPPRILGSIGFAGGIRASAFHVSGRKAHFQETLSKIKRHFCKKPPAISQLAIGAECSLRHSPPPHAQILAHSQHQSGYSKIQDYYWMF